MSEDVPLREWVGAFKHRGAALWSRASSDAQSHGRTIVFSDHLHLVFYLKKARKKRKNPKFSVGSMCGHDNVQLGVPPAPWTSGLKPSWLSGHCDTVLTQQGHGLERGHCHPSALPPLQQQLPADHLNLGWVWSLGLRQMVKWTEFTSCVLGPNLPCTPAPVVCPVCTLSSSGPRMQGSLTSPSPSMKRE